MLAELALVAATAVARPQWPPALYPSASHSAAARLCPPYRESPAALRFGYRAPFADIARRRFVMEAFGARADGQTNCTPAFHAAALRALRAGGPAEIVLGSAGRYLFRPDPARGSDGLAILNVRGARNLVIRGQGRATVLVMADPSLGGLLISNSRDVMVRDLAIDYNPLGFSQGRVDCVEPDGAILLKAEDGFPTPGDVAAAVPGDHAAYAMQRAGALRWPAIAPIMMAGRPEPHGSGWRLRPAAGQPGVRVGDEVIYVGRRLAQVALGASFTRGFRVRDVSVHASPTCGLLLSNVDGASIDGYADVIPARSSRMLSTNADGLYCHNVRGGLTIRRCWFGGQGDDCINLHCSALGARSVTVTGPRSLTVDAPLDLRAGDALEVMDPTAGMIRGQARILTVRGPADRSRSECTLDRPLAALGYRPETDLIYPASLAPSNFRIVGCHFTQNRSRCLLIQARRGWIEGNTFENAEGYGIILGYGGTAWPEGVIPTDITIRANRFRNLTGAGLAAAIEAWDGSEERNFRRIRIEGNRFEDPRKMAILMRGVADLTICGNRAATAAGRRNTWNHPQWYPADCSIYLDNCSRAKAEDNLVTDAGITDAALVIGAKCAPGPAGVTVRALRFVGAPGVSAVRDARPAAPR